MATNKSAAIALVVADTFPQGETGNARANQIVDRAALLAKVHELGATIADAQKSKTQAAYLFNAAARLGIVHVGKGKSAAGDDAEKIYLELANAHNAAGNGAADFDALPADAKSAKSAISLFRSFALPAVLNQGDEFFPLVCQVARDLGTDCKLSPYMAMTRANSRCQAAQDKMIGKRTYIADYGDIASWLRNKETEKDAPDEAMDKFIKGMTTLSQEHDFGFEVEQAMERLLRAGGQFISDYTAQHAH
jgi:hypothetical protein